MHLWGRGYYYLIKLNRLTEFIMHRIFYSDILFLYERKERLRHKGIKKKAMIILRDLVSVITCYAIFKGSPTTGVYIAFLAKI